MRKLLITLLKFHKHAIIVKNFEKTLINGQKNYRLFFNTFRKNYEILGRNFSTFLEMGIAEFGFPDVLILNFVKILGKFLSNVQKATGKLRKNSEKLIMGT